MERNPETNRMLVPQLTGPIVVVVIGYRPMKEKALSLVCSF